MLFWVQPFSIFCNTVLRVPDVAFYPLRPELAESTYHLYRATKNPYYLHVGVEILNSIDEITRVCIVQRFISLLSNFKIKW